MKIIIKYTNGNELMLNGEDFGFYQDDDGLTHIGYIKKSAVGMYPYVNIPLDPEYIEEVTIKELGK